MIISDEKVQSLLEIPHTELQPPSEGPSSHESELHNSQTTISFKKQSKLRRMLSSPTSEASKLRAYCDQQMSAVCEEPDEELKSKTKVVLNQLLGSAEELEACAMKISKINLLKRNSLMKEIGDCAADLCKCEKNYRTLSAEKKEEREQRALEAANQGNFRDLPPAYPLVGHLIRYESRECQTDPITLHGSGADQRPFLCSRCASSRTAVEPGSGSAEQHTRLTHENVQAHASVNESVISFSAASCFAGATCGSSSA
ncbi:hypothetical protein D9615_008905 [Tricholomella constricta]|uniref:Uncharacterized protein n=1 Tax=Tricholomella constricta TaxID=117010 RepID=A0A8H5H011_9AGAR|nr:hypothetical protein D9615_008905 [Tricholomella constricta]